MGLLSLAVAFAARLRKPISRAHRELILQQWAIPAIWSGRMATPLFPSACMECSWSSTLLGAPCSSRRRTLGLPCWTSQVHFPLYSYPSSKAFSKSQGSWNTYDPQCQNVLHPDIYWAGIWGISYRTTWWEPLVLSSFMFQNLEFSAVPELSRTMLSCSMPGICSALDVPKWMQKRDVINLYLLFDFTWAPLGSWKSLPGMQLHIHEQPLSVCWMISIEREWM